MKTPETGACRRGHVFAQLWSQEGVAMAQGREQIDQRPGPAPEIRAEEESVTFVFRIKDSTRLVIRCDMNGNIWSAIARPTAREPNDR